MDLAKEIGFLFDLDGVLIDSEPEYTRIWSEIDQQYPTGIDNFAIKIKGQTLPEILNSNYPESLHEAVINLLNEKEQLMHYEWLPGAKETLDYLKSKGYGCILVTSSNEMKMRHLRDERPELPEYFREIVTADKISRSKPDPEGYLLGAKMLGLSPRKCAVMEDSLQGVRAGRAAGCMVIGLTTTLPGNAIGQYCDIILNNLAHLNIKEIEENLAKR